MNFDLYQESRIGPRPNNQDCLICRETSEALLMVVADGMGGHRRGEVASQLATNEIARVFERQAQPRIPDPASFLGNALFSAHLAVKALDDGLPRPPHTTCVACVVQDGRAWWSHAGDSRLYLIRDGRLLARTRDHSYIEGLLQHGIIRAEDAHRHPQRNTVLSCLGAQQSPLMDHAAHDLEDGDVILLCSDGLWQSLREQTLAGAFGHGDIGKVAPQLLNLAENNGGDNGDNVTLIVLRWKGSDAGPATVAGFPDTVSDAGHPSPPLLSDTEINQAISDIKIRIKPK